MVDGGSPENATARTFLHEIKSKITSILEEKDCLSTLKELFAALFGDDRSSSCQEFAFDPATKRILLTRYYSDICKSLLGLAAAPWFSQFLKADSENVYDSFFFSGEPKEVFIALTISLNKSCHSSIIRKSVDLLEKFLQNGRLDALLCEQSKVLPSFQGSQEPQYDTATQICWDELLRRIISLPDKVSNIFKLKESSQLWPKHYFPILGQSIIKALQMVQVYLAESKDCSLGFVSQVFAKVCLHHHGDELYSVLLPELQTIMSKSPLGSRVCQKLFLLVQDSSLEAVLEPLLMKCKSHKFLFNLLGDLSSNEKHKLKFLMTHKFLLHRFYKRDSVPYCVIGYLAESKTDPKLLLLETTHKLVEVWGNASALKHRSYEQHLYITKCLLLCLGFLHQGSEDVVSTKVTGLKKGLTSKLLDALPPHLQCPVEKFRKLGMIVAEEITRIVQHKDIEPLKFEFERDEEFKYLSSLAFDPSNALGEITDEPISLEPVKESKMSALSSSSVTVSPHRTTDSNLDSDDDLEPYPMDEEDDDDVTNGVRPPVYLRDCISGFLSKDDPSRLESCLMVAEKLIRREPADLSEVIVELVKILLYLQDDYDTANFSLLRYGALVAAAVKCPKQIAEYLTSEFYQENYNLRQRMDMLEVVSAAAQELSQPIEQDPKSLQKHLPLPTIAGGKRKEKPNWQLIVEERIKSKTRIISHGRAQPDLQAVQNRFAPVAGDFFFPLLKNYDHKLNTFDLLGEDSLVLGKLIHTLGSVMQAATGLTITRLMAKAMLDFIWNIRFHREPFIRQALMYALCMTILACPTHLLITELQSDLLECHSWVKDVSNKDCDADCKKMAFNTLLLLDTAINQVL